MTTKNNRSAAKLSLRLWSEVASFSKVVEQVDLKPVIILTKGEPIVSPKGETLKYLATRNYVSFGDIRLDDGPSLPFGINFLLDSVAASDLASEIHSGVVEAAIWVAIFDEAIPWRDFASKELSDRSAELNVKLLVENYAKLDSEGVPSKEYL